MSTAGDGDKRTVATDALLTLGTFIGGAEKRDAIHLAVEPVIAGDTMRPGDHVTVTEGVATLTDPGKGLGIVDPFLPGLVRKGQRFWFVMYPRAVHSLRHVWTHPAFPDAEVAVAASEVPGMGSKEYSEKWLRDFCENSDCPSYEVTLAAAAACDEEYLMFDGRDAHGDIPDEFWDHVETVIGRKVTTRASFFSCNC